MIHWIQLLSVVSTEVIATIEMVSIMPLASTVVGRVGSFLASLFMDIGKASSVESKASIHHVVIKEVLQVWKGNQKFIS